MDRTVIACNGRRRLASAGDTRDAVRHRRGHGPRKKRSNRALRREGNRTDTERDLAERGGFEPPVAL